VRIIKRRKSDQPQLAVVMRWTATIYGLLSLGFVIGTVLTGQFDPVYGLPTVSFGVVPAWTPVLEMLPLLMAVVGAVLLVFTMLAWRQRYWSTMGRVHYTLYTATTILLSWLFYYWNLL